MSNYKHGVYVSETETSLIPTVEVDSAVAFVVGTAPCNQIDSPAVNEAVLINSYSEAVEAFGFQPATEKSNGVKSFDFTLSEFIAEHFSLYANVPVILVNVLDPAVHRTAMATTSLDLTSGSVKVDEFGVLPGTVVLTKVGTNEDESGDPPTVTYEAGVDYMLSFDNEGKLMVNVLKDGNDEYRITGTVTLTGYKLAPSAVTKEDIIGGIDANIGANKGLECIADVYPKFGIVPTLVLAPGFSHEPDVAVVMAAKASKINGHFEAVALIDAPTTGTITKYTEVPGWKRDNGITAVNQIVAWPQVLVGTTIYHASVHIAGVIGLTDNSRGNVPYCSPSNKSAAITGMCLADGTEVVYGVEQANYLNGQGIVTFNNFNGGWKVWGNRTACYPGNTDPKDAFIPVKRMFHWVANTIVLTMWQKVDEPGNRRLIDSIVDSLNVWLNSLTARQQLLGGRIEFREADNPTTDLMDGKYNFKVYLTPPSPAEELNFDLEIDTAYYSTLFE